MDKKLCFWFILIHIKTRNVFKTDEISKTWNTGDSAMMEINYLHMRTFAVKYWLDG